MAPPGCIIIAIDGPAGSGKSTLAKGLSRVLGLAYLDTGATYRAIAFLALQNGVDLLDEAGTGDLVADAQIDFIPGVEESVAAKVILNCVDISDQIRTPQVSEAASIISRNPSVRKVLVELQRRIARRLCECGMKGVVAEGRDTGTAVFPDADLKIFLTASIDERARRRMRDYGKDPNIYRHFQDTKAAVLARDISDQTRDASPLKPADDSVLIDNTGWTVEKTLETAVRTVRESVSLP